MSGNMEEREMTLVQQVAVSNHDVISMEEKRKRYDQDIIDWYKPHFPDWTEDDIVNMLFTADLIAAAQAVEDKLQL